MNLIRMAALLFAMLCSAQLWAAACTAVFPDSITANSANQLNLAGVPWQNSPSLGNSFVRNLGAGNHYFGGGGTGNGWTLNTTGGPTTVVFVNGSLSLSNNSQLNAGGNPQNLILVVNGSLSLANNVVINGFVYVTGSISFGQNLVLNGAITAQGATNQPGGGSTSLTYNDAALALANFGDLCSQTLNQVHHYELLYQGAALTCNPQPVTVRACLDAGCSSLYTGPLSLTLSPSSGWTATAPATVSGGRILNFSGGAAVAQLRVGTPVSVVLGLSASVPASNPLVCSTGGCTVTYARSGFLLQVPNLIAGKPAGASIRAVKDSDSSQACVPGFASGTRTLQFSRGYSIPNSGTQPVVINGTAVTSDTPVALSFDATATAALAVRYDDAGQMNLSASFSGSGLESGLVMTGSDSFVARPAGYCVYSDSANSACALGDASCSAFVAAGGSFGLRVKAVAWQSDTDTDLCIGNGKTSNYQQGGISLVPALVAPSDGVNAVLGVNGVDMAGPDLGEKVLTDQTVSEVGVFTIEAQAGSYLGGSPVADSDGDGTVEATEATLRRSANIGRFYPASFLLSDPILTPACSMGFTYAGLAAQAGPPAQAVKTGQVFGFSGALSARNVGGVVTRNYTGGFAKLTAADISYGDSAVVSAGTVSASTYLTAGTSTTGTCSPGPDCRGYIDYSTKNPIPAPGGTDTATFLMNSATAPYSLTIRSTATDSDLVTGSVTDILSGSPLPDFRLGQARIGNAHGSELQDLSLPFTAAYFNGSGYVPNPLDSCTVFKPANLGVYQRTDTGTGTPVLVNQPYQATTGQGAYLLRAPGVDSSGSAPLTYDGAPAWLKFDWNGDGVLDNPSGLATFGIYSGPTPLIFRREIYGQ